MVCAHSEVRENLLLSSHILETQQARSACIVTQNQTHQTFVSLQGVFSNQLDTATSPGCYKHTLSPDSLLKGPGTDVIQHTLETSETSSFKQGARKAAKTTTRARIQTAVQIDAEADLMKLLVIAIQRRMAAPEQPKLLEPMIQAALGRSTAPAKHPTQPVSSLELWRIPRRNTGDASTIAVPSSLRFQRAALHRASE